MHTLTTDTIAALLRQRATGSYADEAAVELLISHKMWLDRRDFLSVCVDCDHDGQDPVVWVDWPAVFRVPRGRTVLGQRGPDPAARRRAVRHRHGLPARRSPVRPRRPQQRPRRRGHRPRPPGGRAMRLGKRPAPVVAGAPAHRDRPAGPTLSAAAQVVARWSARRPTTAPVGCDECGEALEPGTTHCPQCRQAAPVPSTGMLAVLVETAGGDERLVIAERTPSGGWAATRNVPATPPAVRAVARQDLTRGGAA